MLWIDAAKRLLPYVNDIEHFNGLTDTSILRQCFYHIDMKYTHGISIDTSAVKYRADFASLYHKTHVWYALHLMAFNFIGQRHGISHWRRAVRPINKLKCNLLISCHRYALISGLIVIAIWWAWNYFSCVDISYWPN